MSSPPHNPAGSALYGMADPFEEALLQASSEDVSLPSNLYPSHSSDAANSSNPSSQSYPLAGASVYLLTVGDEVNDHTKRDEMAAFVAALGGQSVPNPSDATHALYIPSFEKTSLNPELMPQPPFSTLEAKIVQCQALNVPIVDSTWLERMSGLRNGEHWSEIDVGSYVPALVAMVDTSAGAAGAGRAGEASGGEGFSTMVDSDTDVDVDVIGYGGDSGGLDGHASAPPASGFWSKLPGVKTKDDDNNNSNGRRGSLGSNLRHPFRRGKRDKRSTTASTSSSTTSRPMGRDASSRLGQSISETFAYLSREQPDLMEEDAIKRAMELSMLDCALVLHRGDSGRRGSSGSGRTAPSSSKTVPTDPHDVLGVPHDATPAQIKAAYRKLALTSHPDKGGTADEFFRVARAYRALLNPTHDDVHVASPTGPVGLKSTAHWDAELQDHRRLVQDLFANHGANLAENAQKLQDALDELGLSARDAGSINRNERNELISNSCFYLSLAASYLHGIGALTSQGSDDDDDAMDIEYEDDDVAETLRDADDALLGETALQLKRLIEAAVVKAHPEWAARGLVGEEVQAFSDFLVYILDSSTLLADWAVAVFDTTSGFVDVYKGKAYGDIASKDRNWASASTITLKYVPGHYQPLIPVSGGTRPALEDVLACLDKAGVFYVVTDGSA